MIRQFEKEGIIDFYKNSRSIIKTSEYFNISEDTISKILKESTIPEYTPRKKINCNEHYFDIIDTEMKAYFLGLLIADGCNRETYIRISLIDEEILKKFKQEIELEGIIYQYIPKKQEIGKKKLYILNIPSKIMCRRLSELGVIPRKSHFTRFPNILESLHRHFIRGVFDGDGCIGIYKNNKCFSIMGNINLISEIQSILCIKCYIKANKLIKAKNSLDNIVSLRFNSRDSIRKIADYIYKDSSIFITRKFDKFKLLDKI